MNSPTIAWSNKFLIGIERIDFEHQIFANLINTLAEKIAADADRLSLMRTVREITKYAEFHFVSEENIMLECKYPGLKRHAEIHEELLHTLTVKVMSLCAGEITPADLVEFLVNWFVAHTTHEDLRISTYCRESGVTLA